MRRTETGMSTKYTLSSAIIVRFLDFYHIKRDTVQVGTKLRKLHFISILKLLNLENNFSKKSAYRRYNSVKNFSINTLTANFVVCIYDTEISLYRAKKSTELITAS